MAFLEIQNLYKTFNQTTAVEDFNLNIERGELVSFLGPSGCGKTTTLRMVAGFEKPTSGSIIINDKDVSYVSPNSRNVGMVFQAYALFPNMTVADNIGFGMQIAKKPASDIKERVQEMLALIHMPDYGSRYPHQLSGGQQQRVALARALALRPEVLLLDEPLSALDAKIRVSLRAEIRSIQKKLGITTIYVTHDQEEALSISDRVVVMNNARMEQVGTPFEIYNFPQTEFVAQFVGTLNMVPAVIIDAPAGKITVDHHTLETIHPLENYSTGTQIMVAVRPEQFSFANGGQSQNVIQGNIANITFLGSIVRIQVKLGNLLLSMDQFNNPHLKLPELGEEVRICCPKESILVIANPGKN